MRITEKSYALFVSKVKALLERYDANPTRVEPFPEMGTPVRYEYRVIAPRIGDVEVAFYHKADGVCYSVFCRFLRPIFAKTFGGNGYSGKCNFHHEDMNACIDELEDFLKAIKRIEKDDIIPVDPT